MDPEDDLDDAADIGSSDAEGLRTFLEREPRAKDAAPPAATVTPWLLESVGSMSGLRRMPIPTLPFRIGRRPGLELVLPSDLVSKTHAEVYERDGALRVRDLGSRNGTYLNRQPVRDAPLSDGDVLHVGDFEFRIVRRSDADEAADTSSTAAFDASLLSTFFPEGAKELRGMLEARAVEVAFQPIVRFPAGDVVAWEALGRGAHPRLPSDPLGLFRIAESLGVELELARLFRRRAVDVARDHARIAILFLNTHPAELGQPGLLESMEELRREAPGLELVLEVHESALARPDSMAELREQLAGIGVGLAYDDFGAGQARLLELAEAPPHYLKFDWRFITGIDHAPASRRRLVSSLVAAARELLVKTIAEGVETAAEAEVCERVGFNLGQGYHFGRPVPGDEV